MEEIAPTVLAESWDNVGFQIGDEHIEIDRIMVTLEVTEEVIDEAIEKNIDLIISHHPLIFKPLKQLTTKDPIQKMVMRLLNHNINLYVAHTNLDAASKGINWFLADLCQLERIDHLSTVYTEKLYKLCFFTPPEHSKKLLKTVFKKNAGKIGKYSNASFKTAGQGSFKPLEGANPSIGVVGEETLVKEEKIEVIVKQKDLSQVVREMLKEHPYETPAYDIIPLENKGMEYSIGLTGYLKNKMSLDELVEYVKDKFSLDALKYVKGTNRTIRKIAICSGAGSDYILDAVNKGCQCFITGDTKYHEAQLAKQYNINLIDAGHFETENIYSAYLLELLRKKVQIKGYEVKIIKSDAIKNPYLYK